MKAPPPVLLLLLQQTGQCNLIHEDEEGTGADCQLTVGGRTGQRDAEQMFMCVFVCLCSPTSITFVLMEIYLSAATS